MEPDSSSEQHDAALLQEVLRYKQTIREMQVSHASELATLRKRNDAAIAELQKSALLQSDKERAAHAQELERMRSAVQAAAASAEEQQIQYEQSTAALQSLLRTTTAELQAAQGESAALRSRLDRALSESSPKAKGTLSIADMEPSAYLQAQQPPTAQTEDLEASVTDFLKTKSSTTVVTNTASLASFLERQNRDLLTQAKVDQLKAKQQILNLQELLKHSQASRGEIVCNLVVQTGEQEETDRLAQENLRLRQQIEEAKKEQQRGQAPGKQVALTQSKPIYQVLHDVQTQQRHVKQIQELQDMKGELAKITSLLRRNEQEYSAKISESDRCYKQLEAELKALKSKSDACAALDGPDSISAFLKGGQQSSALVPAAALREYVEKASREVKERMSAELEGAIRQTKEQEAHLEALQQENETLKEFTETYQEQMGDTQICQELGDLSPPYIKANLLVGAKLMEAFVLSRSKPSKDAEEAREQLRFQEQANGGLLSQNQALQRQIGALGQENEGLRAQITELLAKLVEEEAEGAGDLLDLLGTRADGLVKTTLPALRELLILAASQDKDSSVESLRQSAKEEAAIQFRGVVQQLQDRVQQLEQELKQKPTRRVQSAKDLEKICLVQAEASGEIAVDAGLVFSRFQELLAENQRLTEKVLKYELQGESQTQKIAAMKEQLARLQDEARKAKTSIPEQVKGSQALQRLQASLQRQFAPGAQEQTTAATAKPPQQLSGLFAAKSAFQ